MSNPVEAITAEMVAMTDEVEAVKRLAGHGDVGDLWHDLRRSAGLTHAEAGDLRRGAVPGV